MSALPNAPTAAPPHARSDRFPAGVPYIVGNEGAERFSFYGMKAILKVYLIGLFLKSIGVLDESTATPEQLAAARAKSTEVVHLFVAGVYAFPLIGAVLSDRLLGKFKVIFWVSLIYCLGHAVLAVAGRFDAISMYHAAEISMYLGLTLIAVGSGGIKPCVSANVGDQFTKENGHLVTKIFQIFYFIINYGSFFSTIITPILLRRFGPEVAFGVPGVLMGVATLVFWMGRDRFVRVPPNPGGKLGLLDTVVTTLLFSPLFALIVGYFVLWEGFLKRLGESLPKGEELAVTAGTVGTFFAEHWWLPVGTVAAVAAGLALFQKRQSIVADRTSFLPVLLFALRNQSRRKPGQGFFDVAREEFGEEAGDGPPAVLKIVVVFSMVSVFWALFDQHASTWIDQAKMMDLTLTFPTWIGRWVLAATIGLSVFAGVWLFAWISNRALPAIATRATLAVTGGLGVIAAVLDLLNPQMARIEMDAAQLSALNPLMVMVIIPALNVLVYDPLQKRGIDFSPLRRMTVGMFLAASAFVLAAVIQKWIEVEGNGEVHGLWQAVPYFVMTTAEVLVSITGLEFAYTQAPRAMKSTMMSFWLLCVTFGNLIVAFLAPLQKTVELSQFFWLFAGLMAVAALVFATLAYFYKGKTYLQH